MHFHALLFREYHEIVETVLPDMVPCQNRVPSEFGLSTIGGGAQQAACETLFDGLHDKRWVAALGFAEQEMYVFGHNYVAYDDKTIAPADLSRT